MKISKKLKNQIEKQIRQEVLNHLLVVDSEDRSGKIPHESWKVIHKSGCELAIKLSDVVGQTIENYRK